MTQVVQKVKEEGKREMDSLTMLIRYVKVTKVNVNVLKRTEPNTEKKRQAQKKKKEKTEIGQQNRSQARKIQITTQLKTKKMQTKWLKKQ